MEVLFGGYAGYNKLDLMSNSAAKAKAWTEFLADRPEFPNGDRLRKAFAAGRITRLCECGCNSYDLEVPDGAAEPLASSGSYGAVFELHFPTSEELKSVEFTVFVDERGQLAGVDVDYCGNSYPLPENPRLKEPPHHVRISAALEV